MSWQLRGAVAAVLPSAAPDTWLVTASQTIGQGEVEFSLLDFPEVRVKIPVEVSLQGAQSNNSGIPTPEEVHDPQATWRSRWNDRRWQINSGHPDAQRLASEPKAKLQYLAYLLAKEVIARNFARPELGAILEEMVGLLAALEVSKNKTKKKG